MMLLLRRFYAPRPFRRRFSRLDPVDAGARPVYPSGMRASSAFFVVGFSFVLGGCGGGSAVATSGNPSGTGGGTTTGDTGGDGVGGESTTGGGGSGGAGGTGATGGGSVTCDGKAGTPGDSSVKLMFGGAERNADVHVPDKYDPASGAMLVLNFHGYLSNSGQEADITKMTAASDERGFIVAYPNGVGSSWNGGVCCGTAASSGVDDVGFVSALIDELSKTYCIDPKRVFATGMSNGGFMSNRLGCELSDRIAAIAPVAGILGIPPESCTPGRKVPVIHFHGTSDLLVPYDGNIFIGYIPVAESIGRWREIDGCGAGEEVVYNVGDSQCVSSDGCADGAEVILCTVDGGGHQWPGGGSFSGGGKVTMDLDATNEMLDFFEKHPMP
jgi:polyhydroxybutyrate depolymerase